MEELLKKFACIICWKGHCGPPYLCIGVLFFQSRNAASSAGPRDPRFKAIQGFGISYFF